MVVVQKLNDHDAVNCSTIAEHLNGMLDNVIILMTDEAHIHFSGCVNKQIFH
jgi:hypothetical protein